MSITINDPFLLATYSIAKQLLHSKNSTETVSEVPSNVHVTPTNFKLDGSATVTAQGDGVHVLEISSLHPAISYSLGPSTMFACPAVSQIQEIDGTTSCSTYVAVHSSPDIKPEARSRTIWRWNTMLDEGIGLNSDERFSIVASHAVSRILLFDTLPSRVLLVSPQGSLTLADRDLNVQTIIEASGHQDQLYKLFEYSKAQCRFLRPYDEDLQGVVLILFLNRNGATFVRVFSVADNQIVDLGVVEVAPAADIADISCSNSGHISVLASNGLWQSFQLHFEASIISLSPLPDPISLASLTFLAARSSIANQEVSLLPLDTSLVLLAAVPTSPPTTVVLLLWDLQYSVLLASNTFPIPSTLSRPQSQGISVLLVKSTPAQVMIVLSPKMPLVDQSPQCRSSVLVVPINSPSTSTIANAIGRMQEGTKWISKNNSTPSNAAAIPVLDSSRRALLGKMRAAVNQNQPQAADDIFFQWLKQEEKRRSEMSRKETAKGNSPILLNHELVKQLIRLMVQPGKATNTVYSPKIVRYLFEQQAVAAVMFDEGLLPMLRLRSDWQSIKLALESVCDLPEADIMSLLHAVVTAHRQHTVSSLDAMPVDSSVTPEIPTLSHYLSLCVSYNYSSPALRLAFRTYLPRVEDILCVLEVLESWMLMWRDKGTNLLGSSSHPGQVNVNNDRLPALDKILSFLQIVLDSSCLVLLQHPPSHQLLRKIHSYLEPELKAIGEIGQLRGPLEPFVKAQKKALGAASGASKEQVPQDDWRKRRKQAFAQASLNLGLYQVEELIL